MSSPGTTSGWRSTPRPAAASPRFASAARNLLSEPAADAGNYGSTFWPSPQTAWGWPPLAEIDHGPYRAELAARRDRDAQRGQPGAGRLRLEAVLRRRRRGAR